MRSLAALFAVASLAAVARAGSVEDAADAATRAHAAGDAAALAALAAKDDPDPWLVADELCARGAHDDADAFARAAPRKDVEKLPDYVASRRGKVPDAAARKALAEANEALASNRSAEALAAIEAVKPSDDPVAALRLAGARGVALRAARHLRESGACFLDLARGSGALGWLRSASSALQEAGTSAAQSHDFSAALAAWQEELKVEESRKRREKVAGILGNIGNIYFRLGDYPQALSYLQHALQLQEELGDRAAVAATLGTIGVTVYALGDYQKALSYLERDLKINQELGDRAGIARALLNTGGIHHASGDYERALDYFGRALQLSEEIEERTGAAMALGNLGIIHSCLGDHAKALDFYGRALALLEELGDSPEIARALGNMGNIHMSLGDYPKARGFYERALRLKEELGDHPGFAKTLGDIGSLYSCLGDYPKALSYQERALRIFGEIGNRAGVGHALGNMGTIHSFLGDYSKALEFYARAVAQCEELGDRAGVATGLGNIGNIHADLGDYKKALEYQERSLRLSEELGDRAGVATGLGNIGSIHASLGDYKKALDLHQRALALMEENGDRAGIARTVSCIGGILQALGNDAKALEYQERAIAQAEAIGVRDTAAYALLNLASAHLALGDAAAAAASARRAVGIVGQLATGLAEEEGARTRERFAGLFDVGTQAGIGLGDPGETCFFVESGRAATLLEMLGGRDALRAVAVPEELRAAEAKARAEESLAFARHEKAIGKGDRDGAREARRQLDGARERIAETIARIQRQAKAGAAVVYPEADALDAIRGRLREGETLLLYTIYGEDAAALVVTQAEARIVALGKAKAIEEACAGDVIAGAETIRRLVVDPLGLPGNGRVLVSPGGAICYVPFALLLPDREVAYVPSGTAYGVLRDDAGKRGGGVLALGDPEYGGRLSALPGTREEAKSVGDVVLLGKEATVDALRGALATRPRWHAIHLACHGLVDPENPRLSSLALSGCDPLTTLDVFRLRAPADLVVLSACETARGKVYRAEGVVGFVRAFMFAGAPRVLVSLWKVDDDATKELMVKFYELWKTRPAAAALWEAQRYVAAQEKWKDPKCWAAWQLWGLPE